MTLFAFHNLTGSFIVVGAWKAVIVLLGFTRTKTMNVSRNRTAVANTKESFTSLAKQERLSATLGMKSNYPPFF